MFRLDKNIVKNKLLDRALVFVSTISRSRQILTKRIVYDLYCIGRTRRVEKDPRNGLEFKEDRFKVALHFSSISFFRSRVPKGSTRHGDRW